MSDGRQEIETGEKSAPICILSEGTDSTNEGFNETSRLVGLGVRGCEELRMHCMVLALISSFANRLLLATALVKVGLTKDWTHPIRSAECVEHQSLDQGDIGCLVIFTNALIRFRYLVFNDSAREIHMLNNNIIALHYCGCLLDISNGNGLPELCLVQRLQYGQASLLEQV